MLPTNGVINAQQQPTQQPMQKPHHENALSTGAPLSDKKIGAQCEQTNL
jgi:hypothetical protein